MAAEYRRTDAFRGASFTSSDLTGATFRDCDLRGVKIVDSWLGDLHVSGELDHVVVNDVEVTAFVAAELDRRHPERVQLRAIRTAGDYRAMWDTLERLWSGTLARAERLPEPVRHERVDDEWSFVETLRHLIFATDAWVSRTILDQPMPYHRLGLTHTSYPPADAAALGVDPAARPSSAEVVAVRADRLALVRSIVDGLSDEELERVCPREPAPGYPEQSRSVGHCLRVVMVEECEHHRYAVRDLAVLEARRAPGECVDLGPVVADIAHYARHIDHRMSKIDAAVTPEPADLPAGYPREYERRVRLRDGRVVAVRPVIPADAPQLATAILTADPDTLRRRFLGGPPHVTPALVTRLTTLDYVRRFALAAADERTGQGVAIARYEAVDADAAELAVVVDPGWRRVGLATALVELLAQAALDRGIHEFSASYLAENRPVEALLARAGGAGRQVIRKGLAEVAVALDRERIEAAVQALEPPPPAGPREPASGSGGDPLGPTD
jgi:RimJ/RimL family protein N-acetyltransferase